MSWVSDEFIEMVISEDPICLFKETAMASEIRASRKALAIAREALRACDEFGIVQEALRKIDEVMK